jgi:septal ring factor EnvC (AmiA/AmiB activator)
MERRAPPPTPPPAPPPDPAFDDEVRPATLAELRTLRRWLAVTGVWAVAASAIAIIALLESSKDEPAGPRGVSAAQLGRVQQNLDRRIDRLVSLVDKLPRSSDVAKLERRLKRVEDGAAGTRDDVKALSGDVDDLEQRVEDLEQQSSSEGTGTETAPSP